MQRFEVSVRSSVVLGRMGLGQARRASDGRVSATREASLAEPRRCGSRKIRGAPFAIQAGIIPGLFDSSLDELFT
jgi:hypothetical protein